MKSTGPDHSAQGLRGVRVFRGEDMKPTWKAAIAALVLIGSIALAQDAPAPPAANSASRKTTNAPSNSQSGPEYVICPEDVLHIAVCKETEMTSSLTVPTDG